MYKLTTQDVLLMIFGGFRCLDRLDFPDSTEVMLTVACIIIKHVKSCITHTRDSQLRLFSFFLQPKRISITYHGAISLALLTSVPQLRLWIFWGSYVYNQRFHRYRIVKSRANHVVQVWLYQNDCSNTLFTATDVRSKIARRWLYFTRIRSAW